MTVKPFVYGQSRLSIPSNPVALYVPAAPKGAPVPVKSEEVRGTAVFGGTSVKRSGFMSEVDASDSNRTGDRWVRSRKKAGYESPAWRSWKEHREDQHKSA